MASTPAYLTPEVLRWARESAGYSLDDAADKIEVPVDRLEEAEAGERHLTMRQAERAAACYDRPLATLFMPEPPHEEPPEQQFRRLRDAPPPPWPSAMQALARRVQQRQEAAVQLYELLGEPAPWHRALRRLRVDDHLLATVVRTELAVTAAEQTAWRDASGFRPLRAWVEAVESLGILVMQDGTLPVEQVRGLAATHPDVPIIVVNTQDDPRARAWTVLHELGHLLLTARRIAPAGDLEQWCEEFAGEVIAPATWLKQAVDQNRRREPLGLVDEVALTFGITPLAALVRIARHEFLPSPMLRSVDRRIRARPPRTRGSGGDYYLTKIARLGPAFTRLVFDAVDSQALPLSNAAGLLEAKVNHFERLRRTLESRGELE